MATAGDGRGAGPERAFAFPLPASGAVRLDAEEGRHLIRVRRAKAGDEVVLFDGQGATRLARLTVADAAGPSLEIVGPYADREPSRRVAVAVSLPGAGRADEMIFALAVLGVRRVVPLACERSQVDPFDFLKRRAERLARLVREAAKVNGRSRCLRIDEPRDAAAAASSVEAGESAVVLDPDPALPRCSAVLQHIPSPLLMVGPEGGWSTSEIETLRGVAQAATLWECALRTEEAAVAAASIALGGT